MKSRIPVRRSTTTALKRGAPKCRCSQFDDRFSRMKFFGLLLILIFIATMIIFRPPKKPSLTENERPKFVHSSEEVRYYRSMVNMFLEINIYVYIYLLKKRINNWNNRLNLLR